MKKWKRISKVFPWRSSEGEKDENSVKVIEAADTQSTNSNSQASSGRSDRQTDNLELNLDFSFQTAKRGREREREMRQSLLMRLTFLFNERVFFLG